MMLREFVQFVEKLLRQTNTIKLKLAQDIAGKFYRVKFVKVKKIRKLDCLQNVYNMTVDVNHNYIANGIILKNCDALRYGCEELQKFGIQV